MVASQCFDRSTQKAEATLMRPGQVFLAKGVILEYQLRMDLGEVPAILRDPVQDLHKSTSPPRPVFTLNDVTIKNPQLVANEKLAVIIEGDGQASARPRRAYQAGTVGAGGGNLNDATRDGRQAGSRSALTNAYLSAWQRRGRSMLGQCH
jgi:hypothetical protein